MNDMYNKGAVPMPVAEGHNKLAELCEFVITIIRYERYTDWMGRPQIYVVREVVRG